MLAELPTRKVKGYGWKPGLPDARDLQLKIGASKPSQKADLRPAMPPVFSQLQLGSCTANATGAQWLYEALRQKLKVQMPSRLFTYYYSRLMEGSVNDDSGAQIRDVMKVWATYGAPPENEWPYSDANPGPFQTQPPTNVVNDALQHIALKYYACGQNANSLQWALSHKYPVVYGFTVYDSFESQSTADTGVMPMPNTSSEQVLGGHAVLIVGFNSSNKTWNGCPPNHYIVRNSWGDQWGAQGYFFCPMQFIHDPQFCSDFWTMRLVK